MRFRKLVASVLAGAALIGAAATSSTASATDTPPAPTLYDILQAQGGIGDRDWYDFDIVAGVVDAILANNPNSALFAAADPAAQLTVFLPNDRAFQALAADVLGWRYWFANEATVAQGLLAKYDLATLEVVVGYHVTGGVIDSATALSVPRNTALDMVAGGQVKVQPLRWLGTAILVDNDPSDLNPTLVKSKLDIRASNGIAHGISLVLRPLDL
jgi:uncharacterized surface protein with fasciclin (FAS1) repeats